MSISAPSDPILPSIVADILGEAEGMTVPISSDIGSSISDSLIIEYLAEREGLGQESSQSSAERLRDLVLEVEYVVKQNQILLGSEPAEPSESQELTIICDDSSSEILQNVVIGLRDLLTAPLLGALGQRDMVPSLDRIATVLQRLVLFMQRRTEPVLSDRDYRSVVIEVTASCLAELSVLHSHLEKLGRRIEKFVSRQLQKDDLVASLNLDLSDGELVLSSRSGIEADSLSVASSRNSLGAELQELRQLKESMRASKMESMRYLNETKDSAVGGDPYVEANQSAMVLTQTKEAHPQILMDEPETMLPTPRTSGIIERSIAKDVDRLLEQGSVPSIPLHSQSVPKLKTIEMLTKGLTEIQNLVASVVSPDCEDALRGISMKISELKATAGSYEVLPAEGRSMGQVKEPVSEDHLKSGGDQPETEAGMEKLDEKNDEVPGMIGPLRRCAMHLMPTILRLTNA